MEIKKLYLHSKNITKQLHFFKNVLGFNVEQIAEDEIILYSGLNQVHFKNSDADYIYHYAFLIPTGTLHSAIDFLEKKEIELLRYDGKKVIDFTTGQAIYFYDADGNIGEFIERPSLGISSDQPFSIDQVVRLNEIGLPVNNPLEMAKKLIKKYGIQPAEPQIMREDFCWVGDYNGVIIVPKTGRNWMPTTIPSTPNNFSIWYQEDGKDYHLDFTKNEKGEIQISPINMVL